MIVTVHGYQRTRKFLTINQTNHTKVKHHYCLKIAVIVRWKCFVAERHFLTALGFQPKVKLPTNDDVAERQFVFVVTDVVVTNPRNVAPRLLFEGVFASLG